jgi:ribosomal protein L18
MDLVSSELNTLQQARLQCTNTTKHEIQQLIDALSTSDDVLRQAHSTLSKVTSAQKTKYAAYTKYGKLLDKVRSA